MPTREEIRQDYLAQHDALEAQYYTETPTLTKAEFDAQHGQLWADHHAELIQYGYANPRALAVHKNVATKAKVKLIAQTVRYWDATVVKVLTAGSSGYTVGQIVYKAEFDEKAAILTGASLTAPTGQTPVRQSRLKYPDMEVKDLEYSRTEYGSEAEAMVALGDDFIRIE